MNPQYLISDTPIPEDKWLVRPGDIHNNLTVIGRPFWAKNPNWKTRRSHTQFVRVRCVCGVEKDVTCARILDQSTKSCSKSCKGSPDNTGLKKCTKCKRYLDKKAFGNNKSKKDGLATECIQCNVTKYLGAEYGITLQEYNQRLEEQKGLCKICGKPDRSNKDERWQPLRVDHDHATGEIRGLLCHGCNVAIGLFQDNIQNLRNAIAYLERSKS